MTHSDTRRRSSWISLAAAILILNASLSFQNIWPTPAFRWKGDLSIECAVCLLAFLVVSRRQASVSRALVAATTATWILLAIGRYADVTGLALLGRPVNLYWDVRYVPDVTAMFVRAAPLWGVALTLGAIFALIAALDALLRWALGRVAVAMAAPLERRVIAIIGVLTVALFTAQHVSESVPQLPAFSTPAVQTYVSQAQMVRDALDAKSRPLGPTPEMNSDLSLVAGADVLLIFVESYGVVTWQRPDFVGRLAPERVRLADDIQDAGKGVVSALVESPTFGGSSWFAHISLLSGLEVRDPNTNAMLMTQKRDTVLTTFARHGYRTLAIMPGLWQEWPEGSFYGFQEIYGGERLSYKGPPFGWWDIPDQFSLAQMDAVELSRGGRAPLFVFFPTISTHTPFTPTPPYQPDWARVLTDHPFDDAELESAFEDQPDWTDLSPSYGNAVAYTYRVLGGYLRLRQHRDFVMIVMGDHQPPALVTGEGAPWDVPVHVITSRTDILDRLQAQGFRTGLDPGSPTLGKMHELLPLLLDAFGDRRPSSVNARTGERLPAADRESPPIPGERQPHRTGEMTVEVRTE